MNAILAKLEQKYEAAATRTLLDDCLDGSSSRDRGEAGNEGNEAVNQNKPAVMPTTWQESEPVVILSKFMTEYRSQGFSLCQDGAGGPVLCMDPGVTPKDPERWELACQAVDLMAEAKRDIVHLLGIEALTLKLVNG